METRLTGAKRSKLKTALMYTILIAPALAILGFTIFFPVLKSAYMSLFDVSLLDLNTMTWTGLSNFAEVLSDNKFFNALRLSNLYAFSVVSIELVLSFLLALLLNAKLPGRRLFRTLQLLPWTIPTMVTALVWMWIFQADYGVLNYILKQLGVITESIKWVSDVNFALISVMVVALWKQLPFMTIMLLSGMQSIPHELAEAARIDGCREWQVIRYITLPFLSGTIKSTVLVSIIDNFKMFPLFWIMTQGGPMDATTTLAVLTYQTSFVELDLGRGAAIGVLWTLELIIFTIAYNRIFKTAHADE